MLHDRATRKIASVRGPWGTTGMQLAALQQKWLGHGARVERIWVYGLTSVYGVCTSAAFPMGLYLVPSAREMRHVSI